GLPYRLWARRNSGDDLCRSCLYIRFLESWKNATTVREDSAGESKVSEQTPNNRRMGVDNASAPIQSFPTGAERNLGKVTYRWRLSNVHCPAFGRNLSPICSC